MRSVKTITTKYVDELIDFEPTEAIKRAGIGRLQSSGATALFNMLVRNGVAYLADEVGMGKTYIGLAVMSLLRFQKPDARVLIITPRRNIQEKWSTDLSSFIRMNWRYADHRVKTPQGSPDWPVYLPDRLSDWIREIHECEPHDTVLRMSSFSLGINRDTARGKDKDPLDTFCKNIPATVQEDFKALEKDRSQIAFSNAIREALSVVNYDLVIVDEAHNLKHGYSAERPSSIRNETLHHIFSPNGQSDSHRPWLLLLSATPMENGEPSTLARQFECFGRSQDELLTADGERDGARIDSMAAPLSPARLRELQRRLIVRRVGELRLQDDSRYTRNMYRREWRLGGVHDPGLPMSPSSATERLVNAVIQKNVFELVQAQSGGRFRIGALESFEIYSGASSSLTEGYDDNENKANESQVLPDQRVIADLCESYRTSFSREVPHPKLNAVTGMLERHIAKREKVLVFVRRVATTTDLASRASQAFDDGILEMVTQSLSAEQKPLIDRLREDWRQRRAKRDFEEAEEIDNKLDGKQYHELPEEEEYQKVKDIVPSFFTWFFRGKHKALSDYKDWMTGRRVRELLVASNRFCLLLEENYVDWVLTRPRDVVGQLAYDTGLGRVEVIDAIGSRIPVNLYSQDNYRRGYHAVQYAALLWMCEQPCYSGLSAKLPVLIDEIFDQPAHSHGEMMTLKADVIEEYLSLRSLYPALARCERDSMLSEIVARGVFEDVSEAATVEFRNTLRRREQIRHMQAASLRHGAPVIDLYCAFLSVRDGTMLVDVEVTLPVNDVAEAIVGRWKTLLGDDWRSSGAWELAEINANFDLIRKLNFPILDSIRDQIRPLDRVFLDGREPASDASGGMRSVRRYLNQELAGQSPTTAAMGGQDDQRRHRITTQFRMPGMPWVVVATNVYEEGVDLHTYCKTVVHHGISHTASSVEQRTGRVDRIGGQLQRDVAKISNKDEFIDDRKIQSLFPYQNETFEKYQVRRVLANCNRFLDALHDGVSDIVEDNKMNISDRHLVPAQITRYLTSPFDVENSQWVLGEENKPDRSTEFKVSRYKAEFEVFEKLLEKRFPSREDPGAQDLERHYRLGSIRISITPRSHREGDWLIMDIQVLETELGQQIESQIDVGASDAGWADDVFSAVETSVSEYQNLLNVDC